MNILEIKGLKKYYESNSNIVKALDGVNLKVENGEFVAIIGSSGSGKTTLFNMIGGLDKFTEGEIIIDGKNISRFTDDELADFRMNDIGFIFQSFNLIPALNVYENIVLPIDIGNKKIDKDFFEIVITSLGIKNQLKKMPNELSGGQMQRVAIARALLGKPKLILADEPTGNLDTKNSKEVIRILKECCKKFSQTVLIITHNQVIAKITDRIIQIEDGKILEF
ncbi:MAG: ABC transporter ATP-binding protein [Clostridioides sp.]|jgi:putative ABC transport system ATP-binding protein|nr:ABC transporter ATP-binding protein [Clostridioides sp.]